jgi:hypothetical protein
VVDSTPFTASVSEVVIGVDCDTIVGPSSVELPEPSVIGAGNVVLVHAFGDARIYPVTVSTPSGNIFGNDGTTLNVMNGAVAYVSTGSDYVVAAKHGVRSLQADILVDNNTDGSTPIQDAIDNASALSDTLGRPVVVFIAPGKYTEDLTFKDGVHLIGPSGLRQPESLFKGTAVRITGNHTVDNTEYVNLLVENIEFSEGSGGASPVLTYGLPGGGGFGGEVQFRQCTFGQSALRAVPLLDLSETDSGVDDNVRLDDCFLFASTSAFAVSLADSVSLYAKGCNILNGNSSEYGIEVTGTGAQAAFVRCDLPCVQVLGSSAFVLIRESLVSCDVTSATAVAASSQLVLANSFLDSLPGLPDVDGNGDVLVIGATSFSATTPFASNIYTSGSVTFQLRMQAASVVTSIDAVDSTPHDVKTPAGIVRVDTTTIGAASTINLPDASTLCGVLITVQDVGDASVHAITVASPASGEGVVGTTTINTAGGYQTYRSTGFGWLQM